MDLSQVYSDRVTRNKITNLSVGSNFPMIERDPTIKNLENEVFSKMKSLIPVENTNISIPQKSMDVKFFSFEDAIKELQSMLKG
jgi:hypothetical protein